MARTHWAPPDVSGDILAEALRPDAARPVAVHLRPELHDLMRRLDRPAQRTTGAWNGIRLVVDEQLPPSPGYEIHRAIADRLAG
jgi:hypothetical protein